MAKVIEIKMPDNKRLIKLYGELPEQIRSAKQSGMSSIGYRISQEMRAHIETEGRSAWPTMHPFSIRYFKKRRISSQYSERSGKPKTAFFFLGKFARYRTFKNAVVLGFGKGKKNAKFDRFLERIAARVQRGYRAKVTPKMRRFFGASKKFGTTKGVDFFPIRNTTKTLHTEPRPIEKPVFDKVKPSVFPHFSRRFVKALGRKTKLADREFRKNIPIEKEA